MAASARRPDEKNDTTRTASRYALLLALAAARSRRLVFKRAFHSKIAIGAGHRLIAPGFFMIKTNEAWY